MAAPAPRRLRARSPESWAFLAASLPLALAGVMLPPAHAGGGTLTAAQYRGLIADCRKAATAAGGISPAARKRLRTRLEAVHRVEDAGGRSLPVDTEPLLAALDAASSDKSETARRFASLEGVLGRTAGRSPARGDAAAQAKAILSSREFAGKRGMNEDDDKAPAWWKNFRRWARRTYERFAAWLQRLLRRFHPAPFPSFGSAPGVARFMQFLLYFLIGVAALIALVLLARAAVSRGWLGALHRRRQRAQEGDADLTFDLTGEGIADPLAAAKARAARGAYRDAVRLAYIAALRRLEESGLLVLEPNRTNWEYQRSLRRRSRPVHDLLLPATRLFDRVWYGRRPATQEEFAQVVRVYESLPTLPPAGMEGDVAAPEEAIRP